MPASLALQDAIPRSARRARQGLRSAGVRRWIYLGIDGGWQLRAERGALEGLPRVELEAGSPPVAERLRRPFLEAIGRLSSSNASIEWWSSELAAKNPHYGLFDRLCRLAALFELPATELEQTLIVCDTAAAYTEALDDARRRGLVPKELWSPRAFGPRAAELARSTVRGTVQALAARAPAAATPLAARAPDLVRRAVDEVPGYRRRLLAKLGAKRDPGLTGDASALIVTWADGRSIAADGSFCDPHVGPLAAMLRKRGAEVAVMPRVLPGADFAECAERLLETGERFVFPDLYLDERARSECRTRARHFSPAIPADLSVGPVPLARLGAELVDHTADELASALAYEPLIETLAAAGVRPGRIIFTFEGHAWEQALTWSVHRHMPGTSVVGYDNVNFSRFALSLYPAQSELGLRPLPDRIVTNGSAFREILTAEGFPEEAVAVGCALRHAYLFEQPPEPDAAAPEGPTRVLVATSILPAQSVELIEKALEAFGGDPAYELILKCHPAVDAHEVRRFIGDIGRHRNARFADDPISELLPSSDLMLYAYSVVCYEALAHGVAPVFVGSGGPAPELDQLEPFPDLRWTARTPAELRAVAAEIGARDPEQRRRWADRAGTAVAAALGPPGPDCVDAFL